MLKIVPIKIDFKNLLVFSTTYSSYPSRINNFLELSIKIPIGSITTNPIV